MENNSKQQELETVDREFSKRKVWKETTKKMVMVTMVNLTPDDRMPRGEQLHWVLHAGLYIYHVRWILHVGLSGHLPC